MKRLLFLIVFLALSSVLGAQIVQCMAITKSGHQCHRKAVKDGFCKQHYKIDSTRRANLDIYMKRMGVTVSHSKPGER